MTSRQENCDLAHIYGLQFYSEFLNREQLEENTNVEAEKYCDLAQDLLVEPLQNKLYCFFVIGQDNVPFFKVGVILSVKSLASKIKSLKSYTSSNRLFPLFFCDGSLSDEKEIHLQLKDIRLPFRGKFDEKRREVYEYSVENYDRIKELFCENDNFVENPFLDVNDKGDLKVILPPLTQEYLHYHYRLKYTKGRIQDVDNLWNYDENEDRFMYCESYQNNL